MFRVGMVGVGAMGRGHLEQYVRLMGEDDSIKLVAICDVDSKRFEAASGALNIEGVGKDKVDFSQFHLYNDYFEMLEKEDLDVVDLVIPTYIHVEYAEAALKRGLHVLCEKPMALKPELCQRMIDARDKSGKTMMIAQCLRFWPAYEKLKEIIETKQLGEPTCGYFARHGGTPKDSYQDWYMDETRSGGCLLDQHIHDVDTINWLFGVPEAVSTAGINMYPGAGYDALSTNYRFDRPLVINTQDDWCLNGKDMKFKMHFRMNFERGAVLFADNVLTVYPNDEESYVPELPDDNGYYREMRYFYDCLASGKVIETATLDSTRDTIRIAAAERKSAAARGEWAPVE